MISARLTKMPYNEVWRAAVVVGSSGTLELRLLLLHLADRGRLVYQVRILTYVLQQPLATVLFFFPP
jgi:hypothetical protein